MRHIGVTGVQTCALPIFLAGPLSPAHQRRGRRGPAGLRPPRLGTRDGGREHRPHPRPVLGQAPRSTLPRPALGRAVGRDPLMTDDDFPQGLEAAVAAAAEQPLDAVDEAVLREVALLLDQVDPVPADLVARVQFSLALDEVYAEVAHVTRLSGDALAVRADQDSATRTETLTFSAERLTAMVTVSRAGPEQVRL